MLQRRDPSSDPQDSLPALLLKVFSWRSGSVRHRQELLSLSSTAVHRMRLRTSQRNDVKNGLAGPPGWEAQMQWGSEGWLPGPGTAVPQLISVPELWLCCFPPLQLAELRRWLGVKEERQQWCGLWRACCGRWFILTPMVAWCVFPEMSQALYHVPIPFFGKTSNKLSQTKVSLVSREIWQGQGSGILLLKSGWGMTEASLLLYSCIWAHR